MAERGSRWPLVGRQEELEAFGWAWAGVRNRGVVVFGPAGVGKSRLAEEFLARARDGGWKTGRVTATAAAAAVPLGAVAHLIPAGVDLSDPVAGFAAVARVLAGPQRDRRWAVLVDDLHLLDAASVVLLRQLLDARVVRLIGTVRSGEPISDAVEALTGGDTAHRIDLAAFTEEQTERVLRAALHGPVGSRTLHRLFQASGGNALYLHELVLGALAAKTLASDGEIWELAEGALPATRKLADLVGARLAAASPNAQTVLELLARCESVPLADAQAVASHGTLADLEAAGLVQAVADRRRTLLSLAHPLYGDALRAGLTLPRRRELLLAQAERTQAHGARRREDALHLAAWHMAATGTADPALLVQAAVLARHAHDYQQVTNLLEALPQEHRSHASCLLHGEALMELGRWQQADALLTEAATRAATESERVATTLARIWNLFWMAAQTEQALHVNEAALRDVTGPAGRHVLTVNQASLWIYSGRAAEGLALLGPPEADARRAPDMNVWAVAAFSRTAGLTLVGHTAEAIAWGKHATPPTCKFRIR